MHTREILLVDDNDDDVELTLRAFEKAGLSNPVHVCSDGEDALNYLFREGPHAGRVGEDMPLVVLLDLKMPKVDGAEVLARLRADERTRLLPVTVLTSSDADQDVLRCYDAGANSYVCKPVDFAKFAEAVGRLGLYCVLTNRVVKP